MHKRSSRCLTIGRCYASADSASVHTQLTAVSLLLCPSNSRRAHSASLAQPNSSSQLTDPLLSVLSLFLPVNPNPAFSTSAMAVTLPSWTTTLFYLVLSIVLYYAYRLLDYLLVQPYRRYTVVKRQHIPSTTFIPILGDVWTLQHFATTDQLLVLGKHLATKYGPVMQFMLGPFNILQLADPDYVLAAWKTQHSNYSKGFLARSMLGPLLGPLSMVLVDEPIHGKNRKMVAPAFHFSHLQSMVTIMVDVTNRAIDQLLARVKAADGKASRGGVDDKVEVHKFFIDLALNIIMQSSFGDSLQHIPDAQDIIYNALTTVLTLMQTRSLSMVSHIPILSDLPILGKVESDRGKAAMEAVVMQMVRDRASGRSHSLCEGADLLDILLQARDPETGRGFDEEQIRSDAMTFVLAGHETTSSLMTWVMRDLMLRPQLWQQCREEVERVTKGGPLEAEHLNELVLIDACIHESFRLRPPIPATSLQASVDHWLDPQVAGKPAIFIPRDMSVFVDSYTMHTSKELWGPTAEEYDEQRWVKGSERYCKPKHVLGFNGFSVGSRSCIGSNFALMEAKVMTAQLVRRCQWRMVEGQQDVIVQKLTIEPKGGLWVHVIAADGSVANGKAE